MQLSLTVGSIQWKVQTNALKYCLFLCINSPFWFVSVDLSLAKGYRLVGDVDFDSAKDIAGWITPVPGGENTEGPIEHVLRCVASQNSSPCIEGCIVTCLSCIETLL